MKKNNQIGSIKNTPTRTLQLGLIGLTISIGIAIYFHTLGLSLSAIMVGCFSISVASILTLQFFKIIFNTHVLIIAAVCILLIISSFVEGSSTGQYFYFFPLTVAIPIVVDNKTASQLEFVLLFFAVLTSFAICFYVGHTFSSIENISTPIAKQIMYSNVASAILLTTVFSISNIFYEKQLINKLRAIAYMQSHEMRKPVASIIGLMDIWKDESYAYNEEIISMLELTVTELDEKIRLIVEDSTI
ncbi:MULTISPECIES: hypothetical protein [unclassified Mucilaginibacter]|uniref:hypothetical protein n=1 Tax=unclassified Mucilaginibacter TaxID=2617802 RepID=UPI002AC90FCF|nr:MULTISPECIES: hypothetical protein [unclassified Mucilaginibacter]MEB0261578.1 hypothetical protein [Mucilaginibacter sp. 10I4]MEB0277170.1 hypothetical protein [Mucilaginibacter sp. 10B2]MEB0300818.1 hypothetical protein [Mucilaginibacter sp. 5C4]WPX25268.1 hypothetical protein RHM67_08320 [Mucilaginibacter sp. 5C4]